MNKFLKELENRLMILSSDERQDIIDEYKSNIEEKIKNGKTEKEAVEDFGNIDDLAKEILSAYKINPEYGEKKSEGVENFNDAIKKASSKLADFTDKVVDKVKVNNENITLEKVFEMILKAIVLLIGLLLLKIPFSIIGSLVGSIFSFGIFDAFSYHFVKLLFNILYIVACIVIIIIAAKRYTDSVTYKGEKIEKVAEKMENKEKKTKKDKVEEVKKEDSIAIKIIKIIAIVVFMVPTLFSIIGLIMATIFMIYLTIKCVTLLGPTIIVVGVLCLFSFFFDIIYSLTIRKKKFCLFNLFSCVILMSVGTIITFNSFVGITYIDSVPENVEMSVKTSEKVIENVLYFEDDEYDSVIVKIDEELEDNKAAIEFTYYKEYSSYNFGYNEDENIYYLDKEQIISHNVKNFVDMILENLGKGKVYNYSKLFKSNVIIRANSNTSNKIIIK